MHVLVTGATGFTGSRLVRALREAGHTVRALVRPATLTRRPPLPSDIAVVSGDLTNPPSLKAACEGVDIVYHIAALYRDASQPPSAYTAVNVEGTRHLLEAAQAAGVRRVVHCSTAGVHGHVVHAPADEDAPFAPGDHYQRTKLEGEQLARRFGDAHGLEVVIARPVGLYGPGDTRFLKMFRGIARRRFPMLGRGAVFYHLTYIDDAVDGLRRCGETPGAAGRTYLIAGSTYTTLAELVASLARVLGVPPPRLRLPIWPVWLAGAMCEVVCRPLGVEPLLYRRRVDFYRKSRAFDISRARRELGFAPAVDLETGLRRTAEWYRQQHLL